MFIDGSFDFPSGEGLRFLGAIDFHKELTKYSYYCMRHTHSARTQVRNHTEHTSSMWVEVGDTAAAVARGGTHQQAGFALQNMPKLRGETGGGARAVVGRTKSVCGDQVLHKHADKKGG